MKIKGIVAAAVLVLFSCSVFAAHGKPTAHTKLTADEALTKLRKGNIRYYTGKKLNKYRGQKRRLQAAKGQKPFAVILTCSDSRLPPEIIFDAGLGDLFVIRTAGNVIDDVVIGSIEYAVEHLGVKLVVVLGHERCGAVTAAVAGGKAEGHIKSIVEKLGVSVDKASVEKGDLLDNAIMKNVTGIVKELCNSQPILKPKAAAEEIKIAGAYYDLETGKVSGIKRNDNSIY